MGCSNEYTITNTPTANLRVASIDDERVMDEDLVLAIGKALRLIAHLKENQIDMKELEDVLIELFETDVNILQNVNSNERSDIRRLIRIYDYLKWGK